MVAPHRLSADRTGECYKSLPQEQRTDSVAYGTLSAPRSDAPAPPHNKVEVGIPLGLTTSVDKGNLPSSTPTPGDGQGPGQNNSEQAQVRAEFALLTLWLSDRRPMPSADGQDWTQHWGSLAIFLESDWNEVEWQGIVSREDGYLYALEGYWHRLRHARKRPQLYGPLAIPVALMDIELDSIRALAEAISSGDRSSELELAKRLTDRELQLKTESDEQHPCSTCPSPPEPGLDQEGEGERAAPPARKYGSLIRDLQHTHGYSANGQAAVTDAAIRLAKASDSALDAQLAASTRKHGCLACFRAKLDKIPTIRRLYEQRKAELAAEIAAERHDRSGSDHDSNGPSPPPSVHLQDGEAKPAVGVSSGNKNAARVLSSLTTAASDEHETVRTEFVQSFTDGSYPSPSTEDLDPDRLVSPSADGSSPAIVSASDPSSGTEKKSLQHEPSLLLFHSSPESGLTGNRQSCSVDGRVPLGTQDVSENVLLVEENVPPDIYASASPPSGVPNFSGLLFGSIPHHDILCLLSTRTTTTFAIGKKQSCTADRSKPSPASIRLDVPVPAQTTAHGSPSLLLSSSVAFGTGCVAVSLTRRAPATIARTDSTGVSVRSLAASCEQHASLAPAVQSHTAPVKPRFEALQRVSLSAKAKRDIIRSLHLHPARQDIAFGSLPPDGVPQSRASEYGIPSIAPSASKGPLGSNAGGTSSSVVQPTCTKKAPDKLLLGLVLPTGTKLSSAWISPSISLTPPEPTGPGPPLLKGDRSTSPPGGSSDPSARPSGGNRSTARGGRVSVDELGRRIVAKLHHTDIEQSRITHLPGIGVLKLSVAEQTCGGDPATQQQRAGVSPMSPKVGRDPQGVEVYATSSTVSRVDSSSLGEQPVLERDVEGGLVVERAMVKGSVTEGAMVKGAMTEGAVKGGVMTGRGEHVRPVVKEAKRLGSLTEVTVRTTRQSETWSRPPPPPALATRLLYCRTIDPESTPPPQYHLRGAASRVAASTAAARSAASASPAAAANDAQHVSCSGIGLRSREVQPTESQRRPRAAAEAAEGVTSGSQVSCLGAIGQNHSNTKNCERIISLVVAADTSQASRHGAAHHSHSDAKSCGFSFSPAQLQRWRPAHAVVMEAGSQVNEAQRRTRLGGTQWMGRWNKEGAQQVRAVQEGAYQEGAGTADVVANASETVTETVTPSATSHVDSERPVLAARVRGSTTCASTAATCSTLQHEGASSPPPASPSSGFSMTMGPTAATLIPKALRVNGVLSINEDFAAAVPSGIIVSAMAVITSLSAKHTACRDSQERHMSTPARTRTKTAPHPCSLIFVLTGSARIGYVHEVDSGHFGAAVVVGGMRISSALSAYGTQMFGGICAQGRLGELAAGLCPEQHADMHGQIAPAVWYIWVNSQRREHVYDGVVCANDVVMVRNTNGIGQNMPSIKQHTLGRTHCTIEHTRHNSKPPAGTSDKHRKDIDDFLWWCPAALSHQAFGREANSWEHRPSAKECDNLSFGITHPTMRLSHIKQGRTFPYGRVFQGQTVASARNLCALGLHPPSSSTVSPADHSELASCDTQQQSVTGSPPNGLVESRLVLAVARCSFHTMSTPATIPRLLVLQTGRSAASTTGVLNRSSISTLSWTTGRQRVRQHSGFICGRSSPASRYGAGGSVGLLPRPEQSGSDPTATEVTGPREEQG